MLTKSGSLDLLDSFGMNTVKRLVKRTPITSTETLLALNFLNSKRVSIRTWRRDSILCPFFPNVARGSVLALIQKNRDKINECEEVIFSEGIDPKDSVRAGRISHIRNDFMVAEYISKSGTVRDLDKSLPEDIHRMDSSTLISADKFLTQVFRESGRVFRSYPNKTIEWSQYPYPIGRRRENIIYWEVI